ARLNDRPPAATCVAAVRPVTCTGPVTGSLVPLPSWPLWLLPQASTVPFDRSASMCPQPADSWVIPLPAATMLTGRVTGEVEGVLTSWPMLLSPQPQTEPSVPRTAPVHSPAVTPAMYTVPIPVIRSGVRWSTSVPSPSCPWSLAPQVHTEVTAEMPLVAVATA